MSQGDTASGNLVFRATKYGTDYSAFIGKELTPGLPIELNPDITDCESLSVDEIIVNELTIYPLPVKNTLHIKGTLSIDQIAFYDSLGRLILTEQVVNKDTQIDVSAWSKGIYVMVISSGNTVTTKKMFKS